MAISKAKKEQILATLEQELKAATSVAFTSNTKLTVLDVFNLRNDLRKVDAKFMLAKKTLIRKAFKSVYNVDLSEDLMPGQVAVLICKSDKIAPLAVVNRYVFDFRRDEKIKFVGAYIDGQVYDASGASRLANIPSKEVLLSRLLGSMKSPLSALARFFDGAKNELASKSLAKVGDLASAVTAQKQAESKPAEEPAKQEEVAPAEAVSAEAAPAESVSEAAE